MGFIFCPTTYIRRAVSLGILALITLTATFTSADSSSHRRQMITEELDLIESRLDDFNTRKNAYESRRPPPRQDAFETTTYSPSELVATRAGRQIEDIEPEYLDLDEPPEKKFSFMKDLYLMRIETGLSMGYRSDDLAWGISGDNTGANPNRDNDTEYDKINLYQIRTDGKLNFKNGALLEGYFAYADAYKGDGLETRYLEDDRTNIIQQISSKTDGSSTLDFSLGAGWQFPVQEEWLFEVDDVTFTPMVGYSYHAQDIRITDGVQIIDTVEGLPIGPFSGLDSFYEAKWDGPWIGLEFSGRIQKLISTIRWEYHWFDYSAEGGYNLRTDFRQPVSYTHNADGYGMVFGIGLDYEFTENLILNFNADLWDFRSDPGSETYYVINNDDGNVRLNDVTLKSYALMLGATYRFEGFVPE